MGNFFENKIVIVTGASSGIGESLSRLLAGRGAVVVLSARRKPVLDQLQSQIPKSHAMQADVNDLKSVENLVRETVEKYGRVDILVNSAGILSRKAFAETPLAEGRSVLETNFFGCVNCIHAVLPVMKKQKSGIIVNIASVSGKIGFPSLAYYAASKFALAGLSESLYQELKEDGIFVCSICPGIIDTPMTRELIAAASAEGKNVFPAKADVLSKKILKAIEKRKREILFPWSSRLIYIVHFFFPSFVYWIGSKFRATETPKK